MGNTIAAVRKKKTAKVMKLDGTTFRVKSPAVAADVLRTHPGSGDLIESDEAKRMGIRARPLHPNEPLKPGKIYFLVEIPRLPDRRNPRRSTSGALYVGARERLESLKLYRRSASDLTLDSEVDGAMRVRMRLPKAQVAELMERSRDPGEAAEKIMEMFVGTGATPPAASPAATPSRRETSLPGRQLPPQAVPSSSPSSVATKRKLPPPNNSNLPRAPPSSILHDIPLSYGHLQGRCLVCEDALAYEDDMSMSLACMEKGASPLSPMMKA